MYANSAWLSTFFFFFFSTRQSSSQTNKRRKERKKERGGEKTNAVFFFIKLVAHGRDHGISVSDVLGNVLVGDLEKGAVGNTIHETKIMKDLKNESTKRLIGEETCNSPRLCVGGVADLRREADLWSVVDAMMEKVVVTD